MNSRLSLFVLLLLILPSIAGPVSAQGREAVTADVPARVEAQAGRAAGSARLVRFDGQTINRALAIAVSGERELGQWGNCSFRLDGEGRPVPLQQAATGRTARPPLACLYLAFENGDQIDEYLLTDQPCGGLADRFCVGGYRIDTWIETRMHRDSNRSADWHLVVNSTVRTLVDPRLTPAKSTSATSSRSVAAARSRSTAARATGASEATISTRSQHDPARWHGVVRMEHRHRFSGASHHWDYVLRDRSDQIIEGPFSGASIPQQSGSGGSACASIGNGVTHVGNAATVLTAGLLVAGSTASAAVVGGVIGAGEGGAVGSTAGPLGTLLGLGGGAVTGAGFGAMVGGVLGTAGAAGVSALGTLASQAAGAAAAALCSQITGPPPSTTTPNGLPPLTPGDRADLGLPSGACLVCTRFGEEVRHSGRYDQQTGEITATVETTITCKEWRIETSGTDSNGDGWCDGQ